jgi:putative peptidoglycan binding protein
MNNRVIEMSKYKAREDDCIESIAFEHGFTRDKIWNNAANQQLKKLRNHPNVLCAGDQVVVPDKTKKQENGATGLRHRFRLVDTCHIHIRLLEWDNEPRVGIPYVLVVDAYRYEGETDSSGELKHLIRPDSREGMLMLGEQSEERYLLRIGRLDPVEELSGIQARLSNLGYMFGPIDGTSGPSTSMAIREFQGDHELTPTGMIDEATKQKIREMHGS